MRRVMPFFCALSLTAALAWAAPPQGSPPHNIKTENRAFGPGERLTYSISWSRIIEAGTAVMEVKDGRTGDGRCVYRLVSQTRSVGFVDRVYPVRDRVESVMDCIEMCSLSYSLRVSHGSRKRERSLDFDRKNGTVRFINNSGAPQTFPVPERVQDAFSSLYYLRTWREFIIGKPIVVDVHDSGRTWAVEIEVLGRERISTPAGEFDTIKVRTFPRYEGVFMHKGEIDIWLTDDARRLPVLMKSTIAIGSIVATLTGVQSGKNNP